MRFFVIREERVTLVTHMIEAVSGVPGLSVVYIGANTAINLRWEKKDKFNPGYMLSIVLAVS